MVEGIRAASEFLDAWPTEKTRWALASPRVRTLRGGEALVETMLGRGLDVEHVSDAELASVADTERHQGVVVVLDEPVWSLADLSLDGGGRFLLLDGIQDPGNAGTLLRTAAAFGVHGVVVLEGTVDPFLPKVVRASAGVLSRLIVVRAAWSAVSPWLVEEKITLLVADSGGAPVSTFEAPRRWAMVIGNEGAGPRGEIRAAADARISIPMHSGVESLNAGVAGAIVLFALDQGSALTSSDKTRED